MGQEDYLDRKDYEQIFEVYASVFGLFQKFGNDTGQNKDDTQPQLTSKINRKKVEYSHQNSNNLGSVKQTFPKTPEVPSHPTRLRIKNTQRPSRYAKFKVSNRVLP